MARNSWDHNHSKQTHLIYFDPYRKKDLLVVDFFKIQRPQIFYFFSMFYIPLFLLTIGGGLIGRIIENHIFQENMKPRAGYLRVEVVLRVSNR